MRAFITLGTILALYLMAAGTHAEKCGQRQVVAQKLIFNGYKAAAGAWPWHGAIFYRQSDGVTSHCGVTILTNHFVITAGHCTMDNEGRKYEPATRIYIKVGMSYLDSWNQYVQQHDVIRIILHDEFHASTKENNIALMELNTDITYNAYVQPACLWQGDTSLQKVVSQVGYAVGWGYTEKDELLLDLNEATMPIVSKQECINDFRGYLFAPFVFQKTFCAGDRNGTVMAYGDSGGGLFVKVGNSWVLRGITSGGKVILETFRIDSTGYSLFTDVAKYVQWIKQYVIITTSYTLDTEETHTIYGNTPTIDHAQKTQTYTAASKCGQSQVVAQKLIFNGYTAQPGAWPWHGAMFHRFRAGRTSYACGVTILTNQFVITAAHCTIDQQEEQPLPAERVGSTNLDSPDRYSQRHNAIRIIRHHEYDEDVFENDIALVKLYTEITYNKYVQPICLWYGDTSLEKLKSQIGYTVGWGYDQDYGLPKDLHEATMPIVTRRECIDSDPNYYRKFTFEHKTFCAGYRNGTTSAPGDSGGGLYLRDGNSWVLRGIISNTKINSSTFKVDPRSFVVLTDVSYYIYWIKFHVTNQEPVELG